MPSTIVGTEDITLKKNESFLTWIWPSNEDGLTIITGKQIYTKLMIGAVEENKEV